MADEPEKEDGTKKKGRGLLAGVLLGALLGAGGFYAVFSGMVMDDSSDVAAEENAATGASKNVDASGFSGLTVPASVSDISFLPVEPIVVSLAGNSSNRHLRFRTELEVPTDKVEEVQHLMPRVVDVMNAYLRAIDPETLSSPGALIELRAQILRRVGLVIGTERVNDILVMEFVLS